MTPPARASKSPASVVAETPRSATAIPITPVNPRAIPRAVIAPTRSFRRKWDTRATITGWEVTRTTELATVTPAVFRDVIQNAKWAARTTPIPAIQSTSRRAKGRDGGVRPLAAHGKTIRVANAGRENGGAGA